MVAMIKRVDFYGEESAEVTISDGRHECVVHCFPCAAVAGTTVAEPLGTLDADDVMLAVGAEIGFEKLDTGHFAYRITGRVVDPLNAIVAVGDIAIDIHRLPGGIQQNDIVQFLCPRIDLD
jgi:hypothetical protein